MLAKEYLSLINGNIFLREFSFDKNQFKLSRENEVEFADHVIWIDDLLLIIQLKEREKKNDNAKNFEKWLTKKVIGKATKQIRDSLDYLYSLNIVEIQNQRGDKFSLVPSSLSTIIKLVIYHPGSGVVEDDFGSKKHISKTAGFIHIIPLDDYLGICSTLITPTEIKRYFLFREKLLSKWDDENEYVSEVSLVGQFLYGEFENKPTEDYRKYYDAFLNTIEEFDISNFLNEIREHIDFSKSELVNKTNYYKMLVEFAKLTRIEWKAIKERILKCMEVVEKDDYQRPYRIVPQLTLCGFVFIPIQKELISHRLNALQNFMLAAKYDQRMDKYVAVSFAYENDKFLIDWGYANFPWEDNEEMNKLLSENDLFRPLKFGEFPPYFFDSNNL